MQIVSFVQDQNRTAEGPPRVGALVSDGEYIFDFASSPNISGEFRDQTAPGTPSNPLAWFDLDGAWLSAARAAYDQLVADGERMDKARREGILVHRSQARLVAPVPRPGKLICIGLNYRDHAAESNMPIPERPVVFSKFTTSIIGPGEAVVIPSSSHQVDYEAELAVVIGRRAKHIPTTNALDYVLGYTIVNDVSARDLQFADGQWQRGKSCDTFAPMGNFILTKDEAPDPHKLAIKLRLNGKTMQDSNTDQLIFGISEIVAFISESITLEPGDVIATGTPPGVGFARKPPVFLKDGDVMEVEIESLGMLTSPVVSEAA